VAYSYNYFGYNSYGVPYPNARDTQPATYEIITSPAILPISLSYVKEQLRLDTDDTSEDDYLTSLIAAVRDHFESFTNRTLINTQYRTFRSVFFEAFELRKSKLKSLDSFQYLVNGSFEDVDNSIYYNTIENDYSRIIFQDYLSIPLDKDDKFQSIRIDFTVGYGDSQDEINYDICQALVQEINYLYANSGRS